MSKRKTTEEFIADAIKVHGNKYDYSHTEYKGATTLVTIICPVHGEFQQRAADHTNGHGCKKCFYEQRHLQQARNITDFISQSNIVHKNKYDYSKVQYVNNHTPIVIVCPIHGEFTQQPSDHLGGHGCPLCSTDKHKGKNLEGVSNCLYGVKNERSYKVWSNMLLRTIDNPLKKNFPTYEECELCEEWKEYANFKAWYDNPANGYMEGYDLDKDLLSNGRKLYSPETCCFIPKHLNFLFRNKPKNDGLPNGVYKNGKGYQSRFMYRGKRYLMQHTTIENAEKEYKRVKSSVIKTEAEKLYSENLITEKVYKALIKYSLENLI